MTIVHEKVGDAHAAHVKRLWVGDRLKRAELEEVPIHLTLPAGALIHRKQLIADAGPPDFVLAHMAAQVRSQWLPGGANVRKAFRKANIEVPPVHPPSGQVYERMLRKEILNPLYKSIRERLSEAAGATQAYAAVVEAPMPDLHDLDRRVVGKYFRRLSKRHRLQIIKTFREALGIDVSILLEEGPIRMELEERIRENVRLINSIPRRLQGELQESFLAEFRTGAFDRQALEKMLRERYSVAGYRVRFLSRDQTNKSIGAFTHIRQTQLGITHYRWSASDDERVRPTHQANDRDVFAWNDPPALTGAPGHDYNCRCVAVAIVPTSTFDPLIDLG